MDISLKQEEYKVLKVNKDNSVEENIEAEFSLPEYMPEILRIIKATAEPRIISCKLIDERVTVDGMCDLKLIYTAEDGCVYCFTQSRQFTRHCENESFVNALDVNADINLSYVNCKATGTKKAEIKAGLLIKFNIFFSDVYEFACSSEEKCIEKKCVCIDAFSLGCKKTRSFSMSDTVTLDVPCAFIISQKANAVLTEVRKISNKIMLKGETIVEICYVNSENKALTEHFIHSMPLNQILEVDGFDEKFVGNVMLKVSALEIIAKGEQGNFNTTFDISVGIDASVSMWEEKNCSVICDAYSVDCEIDLVKKQIPFHVGLQELNDTYISDNSFTVTGEGVCAILDAVGEVKSVKVTCEDNALLISGSLCVSFIIKDNSGSLSNLNKIFDFTYKKNGEFCSEKVFCDPAVNILSLKTAVNNSNTVDVKAELCFCGIVFGEMVTSGVVNITEQEGVKKRQRMPITVYFPEKENESLWDIARRYATTVTAIAEENALSGETTENSKILFIPSA